MKTINALYYYSVYLYFTITCYNNTIYYILSNLYILCVRINKIVNIKLKKEKLVESKHLFNYLFQWWKGATRIYIKKKKIEMSR